MFHHRHRRILALAIPIIGGMISQNVLNLVDTLMLKHLGDGALAAVGVASFANFMCNSFITGLSAGVQAMSARRLGEGRSDEAAVPLNGGLLLAMGLGLPASALLISFSPTLMSILLPQPEVRALATPYLQARLLSLIAIGMNYSFRGYWNGVNRSWMYFTTLVAMHASNIIFNYTLIFGAFGAPALGVWGAGLGSAAATYVGTATYLALGLRHARPQGFLRGLPSRETIGTMLRLAVPGGLQQFFFAAGMTTFFAIIARLGTAEASASKVLLDLLLLAVLPAIAFGLASASLVGQALGRKDVADARRWAWDVVRVAVVVMALVAIPGLVAPRWILGLFLTDPRTLEMAALPMRLMALGIPLETLGIILMQSLMGAGDTRTTLLISATMQWLLLLPAAWFLGHVLGLGLVGVWAAQIGYRSLVAVAFTVLWQRGRWATIKV